MSTNVQPRGRLDFIDAHRGLAVLLMLWMHSADGWLRPELKHGPMWDVIRALGGLAAPTFLLVSGLSLGLGWGAAAAARSPEQEAARARTELARGLQLVVLGYALRVQMWMLDAAGYRLAEGWAAALPLGAAFGAAYFALQAWARGAARTARLLGCLAAPAMLLGYALVAAYIPERFAPLFRVDILQAIGASLALLALLRRPLQRRPEIALGLAAAVALATPVLRPLLPGPLPPGLAGYVAQWDSAAVRWPSTLFPLFPWMSYALVGACVGTRFGQAQRRSKDPARLMLKLAAAAVVLALLTCEPLAVARFLRGHWPWLTQLLRVAYRVGAALLLGGLAVLLAHPRFPLRRVLIAFGRASLVVYWVHLELAFGSAAKPIVHVLDFQAWAMGLGILTAAMAVLAMAWLRLRARPRSAIPERAASSVSPNPAAL